MKTPTYYLRHEADGGGYLFHRATGSCYYIPPDLFLDNSRRREVRTLPKPKRFAKNARSAPFTVWTQLTHLCPLNCLTCGSTGDNTGQLTASQWQPVFIDLHSSGVFETRLTGGEPTLHPEFEDIVYAAHDAGLFISLNTCGVLTPHRRNQIAGLPIGTYIVSIEGPYSVNDRMRGHGTFDLAWQTVKTLIGAGKTVRVNTVLCQLNQLYLEQFAALLASVGVTGWTLIPLRPVGRAKDYFDKLRLSTAEYGHALNIIRRLRDIFPDLDIAANYDIMSHGRIFNTPDHFEKRCVAGTEAACLDPTANLRPCILLDHPVVGNLHTSEFNHLWVEGDWGIFRDDNRLSTVCQICEAFGTECAGTCQVISEHFGQPEIDPYCQLQLIPE